MKEFWDQRYGENPFAYGTEPNAFFSSQLDLLEAGSLLLPAEGEGRNAVYSLKKGWNTEAFDYSISGQKKAQWWAGQNGFSLSYQVADLSEVRWKEEYYDAVGLIYAHFPPKLRKQIHQNVIRSLRPGGVVIMEAFSPEQLEYHSGGPNDVEMLYDKYILEDDFEGMKFEILEYKKIDLNEGLYHVGPAAVIRMVAKK